MLQNLFYICNAILKADLKRVFILSNIIIMIEECRPDEKSRLNVQLYHRRTNVLKKIGEFREKDPQRYLIEMLSIADHGKCLVEVFNLFFLGAKVSENRKEEEPTGSLSQYREPNWEVEKIESNYCKMFQFFVCAYFLHSKQAEYLDKPTQQIIRELEDIFEEEGNEKDKKNEKAMFKKNKKQRQTHIKFIQSCKTKVANSLQQQKHSDQIFRIHLSYSSLKEQFLEEILKSQDIAQYIPQGMFPNKQSDCKLVRGYLQDVMTKLYDFNCTKKTLRKKKFQLFMKSHKQYLNLSFASLDKNIKRPFNIQPKQTMIMMKRYTNTNWDEVLMTLKNLVRMRTQPHEKCQGESFQIAKGLIKQLVSHTRSTKCYYPLLNAESVIFNQLSLNVHLKYDNLLFQGLGLLKRPVTYNSILLSNLTPRSYDTFAAPIEHREDNQAKLFNPYYGWNIAEEMNQRDFSAEKIAEVNSEFEDKRRILKESEGWRCLMVISYLMTGMEYHRRRGQEFSTFEEFKRFIEEEAVQLEGQNNIVNLLGKGFQKMSAKINWSQGVGYFSSLLEEDNFDIAEGVQFVEFQNRLSLQAYIRHQLISVIENGDEFKKILNSIKYLLRFYLTIYLQFQNLLILGKIQQRDNVKGKALIQCIGRRLFLGEFAEKKEDFLVLLKEKFQKYETGGQAEKKIGALKKKYKKQYEDHKKYSQLLIAAREYLKDPPPSNSQSPPPLLTQLQKSLPKLRTNAQTLLSQFLECPKPLQTDQVKFVILKLRIEIMKDIIFKVNDRNYLSIQSVIVPCLQMTNIDKQRIGTLDYIRQMMRDEAFEMF